MCSPRPTRSSWRGLGEQARLLGALQMRQAADSTPLLAAQVGADGDVLQHAHGGQQAHVLEGAAHAQPAISRESWPATARRETDLAGGHRIDAGDAG
jgi:hypothetical protein